ncbi:MAG: hypothetical protein U1F20_01675 [Lysobacterales bacterium]
MRVVQRIAERIGVRRVDALGARDRDRNVSHAGRAHFGGFVAAVHFRGRAQVDHGSDAARTDRIPIGRRQLPGAEQARARLAQRDAGRGRGNRRDRRHRLRRMRAGGEQRENPCQRLRGAGDGPSEFVGGPGRRWDHGNVPSESGIGWAETPASRRLST